jgi:hypothetical protein
MGDPSGNFATTMTEAQLNIVLMATLSSIVIASPIGQNAIRDATGAGNDLASELVEGVIGTYESAAAAAAATQALLAQKTHQLLTQARARIRALYHPLPLPIKIVPMPKSIIPEVAQHVEDAQTGGMKPTVLTRTDPVTAKTNRRAAVAGYGSSGLLNSWDEYPFASSSQGGFGASVRAVPAWQNSVQGGIISASYTLQNIAIGESYFVIVLP